jgi:hypothetical protein
MSAFSVYWHAAGQTGLAVPDCHVVRTHVFHLERHQLAEPHPGEQAGAKQVSKIRFRGLDETSTVFGQEEPRLRTIDVLERLDAPPRPIRWCSLVLEREV